MSVLLKVQDLFNTEHIVVKAVDGVSYELNGSEITGIVIQNISYFPNGGLCQGKLGYQGAFCLLPPTGLNFLPPPPVWAASAVIGQVASRLFNYNS